MFQIISHHFQRDFLSYRIIKPSHKKRIQLTIQYNIQIHIKIWTIIIKLQNHIQKLKKISCQRNWSNLINFFSIQLQTAENQRIKYIHKQTSKTVLNTVIRCQIPIGSHFIFECIKPKTHAHNINAIIKFLTFTLLHINTYNIGNNKAHNNAEIKTHQFWLEDSIEI